jgi:hypothetical protein
VSIFASSFSIDSEWPEEDDDKGPYVYEGSHILPSPDSPRGGCLHCSHIPDHITRGVPDEPDYVGEGLKDYLRFGLSELQRPDINQYPGSGDVLLDREQVTRLRDYLTWWLDTEVRW